MTETRIRVEAIRIPPMRYSYGSLAKLKNSIETEGLHRPITVWSDGTLVSGGRRLRAHYLLNLDTIPVVFVDTIEDAAKQLHLDRQDTACALPWKPSELCRLWEVLRRLDEPAAARRLDAARRQGVELRRQTQSGKRIPGRSRNRSSDYVLSQIAPSCGMSETTARRLWIIYTWATGISEATDERRQAARDALGSIDEGNATVWGVYARLVDNRTPVPVRPKNTSDAPVSAAAARQRSAWERSLPQMEGLTAGLAELGPPNSDLDNDEVEAVIKRLAAVRRNLEKIIKQMRSTIA